MGWKKVSSAEPVHRCDVPYQVMGLGLKAGDVIQCDCGQQFECMGVDYGSQHDPIPGGLLKWKKVL